ncbi:RimJ/RimL family protein N-acetyltransferase [Arthrobacter sp. PL16]|uniref:GNAT family N-acetyltransferase n=1 Tax=Arthrobacter sp. PL16 TaxID=3071720 RepID=UPI002E07079A|nr:RimJ/RimL family protein N-acetyltransferase [Arthrobacter sp. PL16]
MNPPALRLRPLLREDAPVLAEWGGDGLFCQHAGWTATSRAALHDFWVRQITDPPAELIRLAVEDPAEGVLVGYVDLHGLDPGEKELGFVIGPSHRWRQGLGRRAAAAGLMYGFEELGLERVWAEALAANTASLRILRSVGMEETGRGGLGTFLNEDSYYRQFRISRTV